ncbi:MAG: rod shape-determining protein MreC [Bacteroidales bacterium]|nr:rod shape-determining protein MreC [Bacteroidales bacterium]MDD4670091.1 rod shape-determining protein MreC [Bacteroidales bacterium]
MGSIRDVQSCFWKKGENIRYFVNLRSVNKDLVEENTDLKNKLALYNVFSVGKDSVSRSFSPGYTFLSASIVKNSVNKQHNYIIIDKGSSDGVKEGMGVVTGKGIAGIVSAVTDNYAYVISFLNKNQSISAMINTNNAFGPMVWDGASYDKAILREIPMHAEINIGDTVSTSGYSAIFPPGIPLGTVLSIDNHDGVSQNIHIQLFQNFKQLKTLDIVINNGKDEISKLETNMEKK